MVKVSNEKVVMNLRCGRKAENTMSLIFLLMEILLKWSSSPILKNMAIV